jgi:circadian clock protein KaiC
MAKAKTNRNPAAAIEKCPTGITGLDEITEGGLPRGRPTLICGGAGSGKTLLSMEFLIRGITRYNEPGVFMAFEETAEELAQNVASLGFDVNGLTARNKLAIDFVYLERSEIEETGEYNLEGLFVRLNSMIEQVRAQRVVLDSIEALFAGLPNEAILRAELRRLFRWLKGKRVTAIITAEQGQHTLTRYGIEEYVSDCVIFLDHRVNDQIATRHLRIVKYRGSKHGTSEYPTLIHEHGLSVLPISSLGLNYPVSTERISTGIPRLDAMIGDEGYYRGASILISGTAGTGKTSIAAAFAESMCRSGERCMYFSFEESADQIIRNMRSIGINLEKWSRKNLLRFHAVRPTLYGLEMHLAQMHKFIDDFKPSGVVVDPITNMGSIGKSGEIQAMLMRLVDFMKMRQITAIFTSLTPGGQALEQSEAGISSLMDTWVLVRMIEAGGERNRLLYVLKSRGMAHSNQMREFQLTNAGIKLLDIYTGTGLMLAGSARLIQEAKDQARESADRQDSDLRQRELLQKQENLKAQAESISQQLENINSELRIAMQHQKTRRDKASKESRELSIARGAD